jgi:hypothetical protein
LIFNQRVEYIPVRQCCQASMCKMHRRLHAGLASVHQACAKL